MTTHFIYTEKVNPQDSLTKSQTLDEAQVSIPANRTNGVHSEIEKDKTSLSEITTSE